jgi:hypothetical protein
LADRCGGAIFYCRIALDRNLQQRDTSGGGVMWGGLGRCQSAQLAIDK